MRTDLRRSCERRFSGKRRGRTPRRPGADSRGVGASRVAVGGHRACQAELERRAQERDEAEQAESQVAGTPTTGKKARGREPKAPEPGPRAKDQVSMSSRASCPSQGFVQAYNAPAVDIDSHLPRQQHTMTSRSSPALRCLDEREEVVGQPRVAGRCGLFQRRERQALRPSSRISRVVRATPSLAERFAIPCAARSGDGASEDP